MKLRVELPSSFGTWSYGLSLFTLFGIALANLFLALSLIAALAVCWRAEREPWPAGAGVPARGIAVLLGLLALVSGVSAAIEAPAGRALDEFGSLTFTFLSWWLAVFWVRGRGAVRFAWGLVVALGVASALLGIAQTVLLDFGGLEQRAPSFFSHYMTYSGALLIAFCLLLPEAVRGRHRLAAGSALTLLAVALFLSLTRGAWVAAGLATVMTVIWWRRRLMPMVLLAGVLGAVSLAQLAPEYWGRVTSIFDLENPSNYDRLCMARAGLEMVSDRPFFGVGPGRVDEVYPIYRLPDAPRLVVKHLHNTYVHMAAETGVPSLLLFLGLLGVALLQVLRRLRAGSGAGDDGLLFGTLLTIVCFSVAGLFEANWRDTELQRLLLFVLAIPTCLSWPSRGAGAAGPESASDQGVAR